MHLDSQRRVPQCSILAWAIDDGDGKVRIEIYEVTSPLILAPRTRR